MAGRNFQVGCTVNNQTVGAWNSKISWDDALSQVNMKTNGTPMVSATVFADDGTSADSPAVPVVLCNP
jgi:hypothetical protein